MVSLVEAISPRIVSQIESIGHSSGFTVLSADESTSEELRLLEPSAVHHYLDSIFERIKPHLIKEFGQDFVSSFEFHTTDIPWLTCHVNQGEKTLILVDTTLLGRVKNEDALVSIIGHEIGHAVYRKRNNIPTNQRATVEEESFCDYYGVEIAYLLDLNPRGAEELFIELSRERQSLLSKDNKRSYLRDLLNRSLDEHLTPEVRVKNIQTAIGARRLTTGNDLFGDKSDYTELPQTVAKYLEDEQSKHRSFLDRWENSISYKEKSFNEKVKLLTKLIPEITNKARRLEFLEKIEEIDSSYKVINTLAEYSTTRKILDKFFNEIHATLERPQTFLKELLSHRFLRDYWRTDSSYHGASRKFPIQIAKINSAISFNELTFSCRELVKLIENEPLLYGLLQDMSLLPACFRGTYKNSYFQSGNQYDPELNSKQELDYHQKIAKSACKDESLAIAKIYLANNHAFDSFAPIPWHEFLDRFSLEQVKELRFWLRNIEDARSSKVAEYIELREKKQSCIFDPDRFWADPKEYLNRNKDLLKGPEIGDSTRKISHSPYYGMSYSEADDTHIGYCSDLMVAMQSAIDSGDHHKIEIVTDLFIRGTTDNSVGVVPSSTNRHFGEVNINSFKDEWIEFVHQNRAIFPANKRLSILVDLGAPLPSDPTWLFDYLDSSLPLGIKELSNILDKSNWCDPKLGVRYNEQYEQFLTAQLHRILAENVLSDDDLFELIMFHSSSYPVWAGSKEVSRNYRSLLRAKSAELDTSINDLSQRFNDIDDRLNFIFECDRQTLLSGARERDFIISDVLVQIESLNDVEQIQKYCEILLQNSYSLGSPDLRKKVIDLWTDVIFEQHGVDPNLRPSILEFGPERLVFQDEPDHDIYEDSLYGRKYVGVSESYATRICKLVSKLSGMSDSTKYELVSVLVDKIEAQPDLCFRLEAIAKSNFSNQYGSSKKSISAHIGSKGAEAIFEYISQDPSRKTELIEFLCNPLTDASVDQFVQKLRSWDYPSDSWTRLVGHYSSEQERDLRYQMSAFDLHRNFWGLSTEARILVMDNILAPAKDIALDTRGTLENALQIVLTRLFPDDPSISKKEQSERYWARTFIELYVRSSNETEWGLLLSCLLTASESLDNSNKAANTGKRLKSVFETLGPAYIKLGQAIHSYPGTPEDIKVELASLKNKAAPPIRWDLLRRIESVVPESFRSQIKRYGKVLGSASFNLIIETENSAGDKRALGVLRPNSMPLAEKGFNHMSKVVKELAEREARFAPFLSDALNIIQQARKMTDIETNMELGFQQNRVASVQYNSRIVIANGKKFQFKVCNWDAYGPEWRDMEFGNGREVKSPAEKQAILIAELIQMLSGDEFDCDRHEFQYKVRGNVIYVFDHGGMSLDKPTEAEKRLSGEILANLINEISRGVSSTVAIRSTLENIATSSDYIERVKKGLLSLSFAVKSLEKKQAIAVLFTVLGSKDIDPTIRNSLLSHLDTSSKVKSALSNASLVSSLVPGYSARRRRINIPFIQ